MRNLLQQVLDEEKICYETEYLEGLVKFSLILKEWNKKINLTTIENDEEMVYKHFLDSLLVLKTWSDWENKKIIDVGTGAGFPGIPLKIFQSGIELHLLDSLKKRINFLEYVSESLDLQNIKFWHDRAENLGRNPLFREGYDLVLARAVARLPILLEICIPLVKKGGSFIALKGPEGDNELKESQKAMELLGAAYVSCSSFTLCKGEHVRNIYIFKKVKNTPEKYPRRAGIPQKRPLLK